MLRFMEITNLAPYRILIGDKSIAANASLVIPYEEYLQVAIDTDLSSFPISVSSYDADLRYASVSDFGAKGDGINDDTLAIQSAIDYVESFGGGIVNVPIGVYIVSSITIDGNVSLEGESKEHTVLKQKPGVNSALLSISNSRSGIYRLTIKGNYGD